MAYSIGDLIVRILGDDADFQKKIKGVDKEADKASKSVGKSFDVMKVKSIAMGVASAAAIVKTIDFLKDSTMVAINAQETFSKFDVVFSQMGSAAENAAKQFQESFDLAGVTAQRMLANTGNLLTGFGATQQEALDLSVQVNTLASDLASFTNYSGGAEGASDALTRALLGERESLKQLGIVIREEDINVKLAQKGLKNLEGNALNLAKAQATLEIALEQGKNAIGDYERTHDSAANTLKRAKEATTELQVAIGTALSPSVSFLGDLWARVATELANTIKASNDLRDAKAAIEEGTASTDQYILALKNEAEQLRTSIHYAKQYNQELVLQNSTKRLAEVEKELYAKQQLALVEARMAQARQQQNREAENLAKLEKARIEANIAAANAEEAKLKKKSEINQQFLTQADELNWRVNQGLLSEKEEREALYQATVQQIDGLYQLYVQTGDQSILTSESMEDAILRLERLGSTSTQVAGKMTIDFNKVAQSGIDSMLGSLTAVGQALVEGENAFQAFGKMGLLAVASMLEAIAAQLSAQAALSLASGWSTFGVSLSGVAPALAGSAAAYLAAGVLKGMAGSFADGGIVPGTAYSGDRMTANVDSGEMIINREDQMELWDFIKGRDKSGQPVTIILELDGEQVARVVAPVFESGQVRLKL